MAKASADQAPNETAARPAGALRSVRIDGRRLRSERTKQLVIEAYLALVRENPVVQMPTAAQIAERAGYSVRSTFERFPELSKLHVAAADYSLAQAAALAPARNVDGDRQVRIRTHVETRAGTCERTTAVWRVFVSSAHEDADLHARIRLARERTVNRLKIMFRPELSSLPERESQHLLIALEAITDHESWGRMREQHGLSVEEACAVRTAAIDRLLPPTPS